MKKVAQFLLFAGPLLVISSASVRSEELRFECADNMGQCCFAIIVDTKTRSVTMGYASDHGRAVISGSNVSIALDDGFRAQLNTKTGVLTDAEGGGSCKRGG